MGQPVLESIYQPHNGVFMGYMMVIQWHLMGFNGTTGAGICLPTT